jgi:hypothetical protein
MRKSALTMGQLERMLSTRKAEEKAKPLVKKRAALLKAAEKLEKKIRRIMGRGAATATRGRRRGRKRGRKAKKGPGRPPKMGRRGRPPKKGKRGRPAKKGRKLSAAGRRAIIVAQKARWAKAKKA